MAHARLVAGRVAAATVKEHAYTDRRSVCFFTCATVLRKPPLLLPTLQGTLTRNTYS